MSLEAIILALTIPVAVVAVLELVDRLKKR
jgi:hypothetical protein